MFFSRIIPIATDTDIEYVLKMKKKIGAHINPNSIVFDLEAMFFAVNSHRIAMYMSNSTETHFTLFKSLFSLASDSKVSTQNKFVLEMMQRLL